MYIHQAVLFLLLNCLLAFHLGASEPFRELSNQKGQTILARPVGVFGDKVRIELKDGREMNVALVFFTEEDAAYLKDWAIRYLGVRNELFIVDVNREEDKTADYKKDVTLTNGGVREDALEIEEFDGYYEISLENRSSFSLNSIRLDYRIFSVQDNNAKKDRHDVSYTRKAGSLRYQLEPKQSLTQKTEVVKLIETKLGKGVTWSSGGDLESKAKMIGIWFRIYQGDTIIHEFALPTTLPSREDW